MENIFLDICHVCRYEVEANKAAELEATSARLSSELTAAQLEAQAAQESAAAANAAASAAATSAATAAADHQQELTSRPSSRRSSYSEQTNFARVSGHDAFFLVPVLPICTNPADGPSRPACPCMCSETAQSILVHGLLSVWQSL